MNVFARTINHLEGDAYYEVVGVTPSGVPLPAQVFYLEEKTPRTATGNPVLKGCLYTRMWNQIFIFENYVMYPNELQLMKDDTDVRLEKRDINQARALMQKPDGEHEMFQHRVLYGYR